MAGAATSRPINRSETATSGAAVPDRGRITMPAVSRSAPGAGVTCPLPGTTVRLAGAGGGGTSAVAVAEVERTDSPVGPRALIANSYS